MKSPPSFLPGENFNYISFYSFYFFRTYSLPYPCLQGKHTAESKLHYKPHYVSVLSSASSKTEEDIKNVIFSIDKPHSTFVGRAHQICIGFKRF